MVQIDERTLASVLELFRKNPAKQFNIDALDRLARHERLHLNFSSLVKSVTYLEQQKNIVSDGNGKFQLTKLNETVEGSFRANDKGFGFVRLDQEGSDDIFIGKDQTNFALDGDRVQVKIIAAGNPFNGKGPEGQVVEVLERGVENLVGEFTPLSDEQALQTHFAGYVTASNKKLSKYRVYVTNQGLIPQLHDMVKASIATYPGPDNADYMTGAVIEVIGNKNDPGVDIMSIVAEHEIRTEWPQEVLEQAASIPDHVTEQDKQGYVDLTSRRAVTIDGDHSKDFDDAVSLEKLPNGNYLLGVMIADVAHYVKEGDPLDQEAYARSNSTYLVDRVIPMLPFRLSNGICSLNEGVERLTLACDMEITPTGERVGYKIYPAVIKSHGRLTYSAVNQVIDQHDLTGLPEKYHVMEEDLLEMGKLHEILYNNRHERGAIDFEEPEAEIVVDESGKPIDIVLHERATAEKMIESFMLLANETVAEDYYRKHLPFLYRVHETPDQERITSFFEFLSALGVSATADPNNVKPLDLQKIVTKTVGTPEEAVVQTVMLRSLKQARYSEEPLGHFGLAAKYYTHFTSPIRRYSDLMVHRMIHAYAEQGTSEEVQQHFANRLPDVAEQTSTQERRSIDTERSVNDLKMTEFMADQVGQHFDAIVSSVMSFGLFIALPNTVEGLIHISNMNDDFYSYNEKSLTMVGRATHKTYKIGMPVKVTLLNANVEQHQLDFEIYDPDAPKRPARPKDGFRRRGNNFKKSDRKPRRDRQQNHGVGSNFKIIRAGEKGHNKRPR